jgi:hypothetical protein
MELGLDEVRFPGGLPDRFMAYFPNPDVSLAEGIARDNLWDANRDSRVLAPDGIKSFQFLLIFPRGNLPEATANVHFSRGRLAAGPFLSAGYVKSDGRIDLNVELLSDEKDVALEISGVPEEARLSPGRRVSDTGWRLPMSPKIRMSLPDGFERGIRLGISAYSAKTPSRASHFSLIVSGPKRPAGYPKTFREVRVDVARALGAVPKLFCVSSAARICVPEGRRLGERWLVDGKTEVSVRLFDGEAGMVRLMFSYIQPDWLGDFEEIVKAVDLDFGSGFATAQDYRSCIFCAGGRACPMFRDFMDYIGNDTLLRQIV